MKVFSFKDIKIFICNTEKKRGVFKTLSIIQDGAFSKNS